MEEGRFAGLARSMPHTCNLCKRVSSPPAVKLLSCGRCKAAWYCGAAHQKLDHAHHRDICRVIHTLRQKPLATPSVAEVRKLLGADVVQEGDSEEALRFMLHKRLELTMAQRILGRELQRNESELIMFQDKCVVCFEGGIHPIKPQSDPVVMCPCRGCHVVSWCHQHKDHAASKQQHATACESYRLLRECERHSALTGEPFVEMSFPPETQYQSLPMDWDSYYARRVGQSSASSMSDVQKAMASSYLSAPLTLLYALERVLGAELEHSQTLCVHLLGTTVGSEYVGYEKYLEILHCLPGLKRLDICMVGPENDGDLMPPVRLHPQDSESRELSIKICKGFYHDFAASADYTQPHLALGMNAGLHELPFHLNTWLPTLSLLVERGTPTVFTSFTQEESEKDVALAERAHARITTRGHANPWRSLQPLQEMEAINSFFYLNHVMWSFAGRQS